jgi:hypothetical protein
MRADLGIKIDEWSCDTELNGICENAPIMAMLREVIRVCHRRGVTHVMAKDRDNIYITVKGMGSEERSRIIDMELRAIMEKYDCKYLCMVDDGYARQQEQFSKQFLGEF